jgi:hypothetical protein
MPYNVRSRENLKPRELYYEEKKKPHEVTVTAAGWEGFKALATAHDLSASELVERLGRGTLSLGDALGDEPQGEVLAVVKWGNVHCKARDAVGNEYDCKRISQTA